MLDVFGLGNAIVDTIAFVEEGFPEELGLQPGVMTLADAKKQRLILEALQPYSLELRAGGSAANSIWAVMRSGGQAGHTCKLADDPNGQFYRNEFKFHGIRLPSVSLAETEGPTGTCVVLTTPNTQRTMSTHLGIAVELAPTDIDRDLLRRSRYVYCEGYLWTSEKTRQACLEAMQEAKKANIPVAFSYSDPVLVENHRADFERISREYCHIVFCNAEEAQALSQTEDLTSSLEYLQARVPLAFVTNGKEGCSLTYNSTSRSIAGFAAQAIDTNGAGDAFAGGVLFALAQGYDPGQAARWGNYLGSQVVCIHGPRLDQDYRKKVKDIL